MTARRTIRWRLAMRMTAIEEALEGRWWMDPMWELFAASKRVLCLALGHWPDRDHCGKPEHDYCTMCDKSMPGQAKR